MVTTNRATLVFPPGGLTGWVGVCPGCGEEPTLRQQLSSILLRQRARYHVTVSRSRRWDRPAGLSVRLCRAVAS